MTTGFQFLGYKNTIQFRWETQSWPRGNLTYTWDEVPLEYASSIPRLAAKEIKRVSLCV